MGCSMAGTAQETAMKNANTHDIASSCSRNQLLTTITLLSLWVGTAMAEPVQWSIDDGGNGHWYELLTLDEPVSPEEHFQFAESLGAHTATMSTAAENTFCFGLSNNLPVIIGVRKEEGTNQGAWITGEQWNYTNWHSGEGDNSWERYVNFWAQDANPSSHWQDTDLSPKSSSLLEWDADCNGDGIVDYGQILDGSLEDADGNGVPDCCDQGVPCDAPVTNHVLQLVGWPDVAVIPHHQSITPLDAMTIEFWIKTEGSNGDGRPITKRPGNGGCYTIGANPEDDSCVAGADVFGTCNGAHWGEIPCDWVHLALTVDGATGIARAYRNGDLVSEHDQDGSCTIGQGTWDLRFGNTNGFSTTQFIGRLDNIRIWNTSLDEQQIQYWMNTEITPELAGTLPELGGSWNFEDGVTDATGVNDGWLEGGAMIVEDGPIVTADCDGDGVPDAQELAEGSTDYDADGVPDECQCLADLDADQRVAVNDLLIVIAQWGSDSTLGDINRDGLTNINDLLLVILGWGDCP